MIYRSKIFLKSSLVEIYQCLNLRYLVDRVYSHAIRFRFKKCGPGLRLTLSTSITSLGSISIGKNFSAMGRLSLYANNGEILIGNNCDVNTNVVLRSSNHGMVKGAGPMKSQPVSFGEIVIEDDVWIGANAVVLSGVTIAHGSVIAAGCVVSQSTEPYSIIAGIPGRKISERT
jgi:acetyltransferase-like isoleucine patch superfamily enzyme